MQISENLKLALEKECENLHISTLKNNVKNISENYRSENKKSISLKQDILAYSLSRMPATFCAVFSSFKQVLNKIKILPKTLLDVGCGTGSATFAINNLIEMDKITCLENESEMLSLCKKLISFDENLTNITTFEKFNLITDEIKTKSDMVVASYVLNELSEEEQIKAVEKLWNSTNNILLIIEPGTPKNFREMQKIRTYLLNKNANLIAPCPHNKPCPIKENDWCHFTVRVERSKVHKQLKQADSPFEDEKFTYLAFSKLEKTETPSRVLRHPFYQPKLVTLDVCTNTAEKKTLKISKSNPNYKLARKVSTGDEFV